MAHSSIRNRFNGKHSIMTLPCHASKVHSVKWSPDGFRIASGGQDRTMRLHRITESTIQQDLTFKGHSGEIDQLCWCPIDFNCIATSSIDKSVRIWDVRSPDPCSVVRLKNENMSISWCGDGSTIAVADKEDVVTFIDARDSSFKVIKDQSFKFQIGEITWNRENDLFFLTSSDGKIHILSYPDLQSLVVIDAFSSACICIEFDPSGRHFAVGSNDAIASVWDAANLICTQTVTRPDWPVRAVSFSHDSRYIASGSEDSYIDIADIYTGDQVTVVNSGRPTMTLDFHPKEYILAYATDEGGHRDEGSIKIAGIRQ